MNVYINKDDEKSVCAILEGYEKVLTDENICDLFEDIVVPVGIQKDWQEYSFIDGEFVVTSTLSLSDTGTVTEKELMSMKETLISESSEVLLEYFEREKMIEMGLETDSTLTIEEFQSWSTYRNSLKNWDVSVDSTPPTR